MALKSIVDIQLDDSAFQRFKQLFDQYNAQLAKTPGLWARASKEQAALADNFQRMVAAMMAQSRLNTEAEKAQDKQEKHLTLAERLWTSMARSTKAVTGDIAAATKALFSWAGIIGAMGGLLGAGGLWGIDRIASSVGGSRRTAMGLGLNIGQLKAFGTYFSRLVDPESFLGWLNTMETDISKQAPMRALGVMPTGNTGNDAIRMLQAIRGLAQRTPLEQLGPILHAYGLDVTPEEQRRFHDMGDKEFAGLIAQYRENAERMNVPNALGWQQLQTTFEANWNKVTTAFQTRLGALTPQLDRLSSAFTQLALTVINNPKLGDWIEGLAVSLESLGASIAKIIGSKTPVTTAAAMAGGWAYRGLTPAGQSAVDWLMHTERQVEIAKGNKGAALDFLSELDQRYGLPPGLLESTWMKESSQQFTAPNSSTGAEGPFQFMPKTAAHYGIDPQDFEQAARGAAMYYADLLAQYHGDADKARMVYGGYGDVLTALVNRYHEAWEAHLPANAAAYLSTAAKPPGVRIEVMNNTGGSSTIAASQLVGG